MRFAVTRPRTEVLFDHVLPICQHRWLGIGPIATAGAAPTTRRAQRRRRRLRGNAATTTERLEGLLLHCDALRSAPPNQRRSLVWQHNTEALRNRPHFLSAVLAGAALIALIAFVAAIQPQHQGQQPAEASGVKLISEPPTIRSASGANTTHAGTARTVAAVLVSAAATGQPASSAVNGDTDTAPPVPQQFDVRTLTYRSAGQGVGDAVAVDDQDTGNQDDDDWAQQQEEEQDEEEQQEQQDQDERQAQQALQQAEQEIQESEQEAEEQNEQAEQQAQQDEQQALMDEQQAGQ